MDYLDNVNFQVMDWPLRSPDLNPIEHHWNALEKSVRRYLPAPTILQELKLARITFLKKPSQTL